MPISESARRYLEDALDYIEQRSVQRDRADWANTRAAAQAEAVEAQTPADTYSAIRSGEI